jgi:hypothetical protein
VSTNGLRERPEARWALWSGIAGALAAAALSVKGIFASGSSTAALGFIVVPLIAVLGAIPVGIWGAALGHVVLRRRGAVQSSSMVLLAALAVAAALPAAVVYEVQRGLRLEAAVREALAMDAAQLERAFAESPWRRDRYFLAALAQSKPARAALLARIAALDDPELYERMGSLWDVMGANRKGLAVMRLVASHPNTDAATLTRLAARPDAPYLLHDLLANPNTPLPVLAPHFESADYLVEWGLARNPNTPQRVLERLARSPNLYTRMNLTYNRATPRELLERLAQDPDESLARNAKQAIERRAGGR